MANERAEAKEESEGFLGWVGDIVRGWGPALLAVLLIRTYLFEPFRIPSGSMVPTLQIGDHVLVTKFSYGIWVPTSLVEVPFTDSLWVPSRFELVRLGEPARGDIVVFRYPRQPDVHYIKRVVALPGETIRVEDNQIFINGAALPRELVDRYGFVDQGCISQPTRRYLETFGDNEHEVLTHVGFGGPLANTREFTVPPDQVFVMGDNRDNSQDSRAWEFVRYDQIKGKAHFVWLSWDSCSGTTGGVRTERFFRSLYGGGLTPAE